MNEDGKLPTDRNQWGSIDKDESGEKDAPSLVVAVGQWVAEDDEWSKAIVQEVHDAARKV